MAHDDPTRRDYRESIETMADVIEDQLADDPDAHPSDLVWEQVDSSAWIIYTSRNLKVLEFSTNEPGEWKHLVGDGDSYQEVLQAMAYATMDADLWDELRERDEVSL